MIAPALERSLGPWADRAGVIAEIVAGSGGGAGALEASVRGGDGSITGGRMMIDRLDGATARAILGALPVPVAHAEVLLAFARIAPLIVGWDTARERPVAKIYVNLSDAARTVRVEVASALGAAGAPHVVGLNFGADRVERKLYHQLDVLPPDAPDALVRFAAGLPLAGVVRSLDVGDAPALRATFVAPRRDVATVARLTSLPGWDPIAFERALPFAAGHVRSVGFAADGTTWTVYVRPGDAQSDLWSLEPTVCVRSPRGEIGIYVAPASEGRRAYARTSSSALSYRVREGALERDEIERVMQWAVRVLGDAERDVPSTAPQWVDPPRGFRVVER